MAKITARGDWPVQAWELANGGRIVYTKHGRVLRRDPTSGKYNLIRPRATAQEVAKYAQLAQAIAQAGRR